MTVAEWMVNARASQAMPDGERWTQDYFLRRLREDTGWQLHRSNLSAYENGRQVPNKLTLRRLIDFWQHYGVEPPNLNPAPVEPPVDPVAAAIREQTAVFTRLADALETRERNQRAWEQQLIRALRIEMGEHRAQGEEVLERLGELAASLGLEGTPNGGGRGMPGHEG